MDTQNVNMEFYQNHVDNWMQKCFGAIIASDRVERNYRFLEEALELTQSCGLTKEDAIRLVDYVFDRPVGEIRQEVGGVMVTLAALCNAHGISLANCAEKELARVYELIDKIREKQASKKIKSGPLP